MSVQFVTALMPSSQRARGLPLFLVPPPIPSIIDFSKLFSLRMICPKYDSSCCFDINASSWFVALISPINVGACACVRVRACVYAYKYCIGAVTRKHVVRHTLCGRQQLCEMRNISVSFGE